LLYWNANSRVFGWQIGLKPLHDETTSKYVLLITSKSSLFGIHATFLLHQIHCQFQCQLATSIQIVGYSKVPFEEMNILPISRICLFYGNKGITPNKFPKESPFSYSNQVQLHYGTCTMNSLTTRGPLHIIIGYTSFLQMVGSLSLCSQSVAPTQDAFKYIDKTLMASWYIFSQVVAR